MWWIMSPHIQVTWYIHMKLFITCTPLLFNIQNKLSRYGCFWYMDIFILQYGCYNVRVWCEKWNKHNRDPQDMMSQYLSQYCAHKCGGACRHAYYHQCRLFDACWLVCVHAVTTYKKTVLTPLMELPIEILLGCVRLSGWYLWHGVQKSHQCVPRWPSTPCGAIQSVFRLRHSHSYGRLPQLSAH